MKFTDADITPAGRRPHVARSQRGDVIRMVADLSARPGVWAEVDRYPLDRIASARSRASQTVRRYPGLEYAVERERDEAVVYFRWAEA